MFQNNDFYYINEILFGSNKNSNDEDLDSDINIYNYFKYKANKKINFINHLCSNLEQNQKSYTFNYDYNSDEYINEFYKNIYNIEYYAASFNDNKNGLERVK